MKNERETVNLEPLLARGVARSSGGRGRNFGFGGFGAGEILKLGDEESAQGQGRSQDGQRGNPLREDQGRGDHRNDRAQVNIDAGANDAEHLDRPVPAHKTEGRGAQTQKKEVEEVLGLSQARQIPFEIREENRREHEEEPIDKASARDLQGVVMKLRKFTNQDRV